MSIHATLTAQLARFDDEAWVALANRGLLRRATKDLMSVTPQIVGDDDTLRLQVGPHVVTFDARGPATATCSCPSPDVCRHVVSAGLWLASASDDADDDPAAGLHEELMSLGQDPLIRHAGGKAAYRWAFQYVDDLDLHTDVRIERDRQIVIALTSPHVTFRYAGGGLDGLIPDTRLTRPTRYAVAAVLAYQRANGTEPAAPAPPSRRTGEGTGDLAGNRGRLRAAATRLLTDTVRLGLAHLSPAVHQRYETLAVWAQGVEYHRLALLLRRLADHVELLLDRSARADEQQLLDETAVAHALVAALEAAAASGAAPARLVGQARNSYEPVRNMELYGLGSLPWRTPSGYHGLTTLFWWPTESRFLSLTDARPESLRGYDPRARHAAAGPWTGLTCPAAATGAAVHLTDARLSGTGRLSAVERTQARVAPCDGADIAAALSAVTAWSELESRSRQGLSLLDSPDPLRNWAVIRPAAFELARFDPITQTLTWVVRDEEQAALSLVLPYTTENAHALERVENLTGDDLPPGTLVACRCQHSPSGLVGEPLSIIRPDLPTATRPVDALHFDPPRNKSRQGEHHPTPPAQPTTSIAILPTQLLDLRAWLVRHAERGTGATAAASTGAALLARHRLLRDIGFDIFPVRPIEGDPAAAVLRSHFLVMQTTRLLVGEPS